MLRALFFLLLALNLGVLAWHAWIQPDRGEETILVDQPGEADRLQRLEPLEQDEPPAREAVRPGADNGEGEREAEQATAEPFSPAGCLRVGGQAEREPLLALAADLGIPAPELETTQAETVVAWWVVLPPGRVDDPGETGRRLEARGERDYFVIGTDDMAGGISLGLYSSPERAEARAEAIRALDFRPEIRERTEPRPRYWLNLPVGFDFGARWPLDPDRWRLRPALCPGRPDSLVTRPGEPLE